MKINKPVTDREQAVPTHVRIISTTDPKGRILYANEEFETVSGFRKAELENQAHNIVRHPDMPPEVFANLWETLKQGKPWIGIVKNRCKNGDYYWVDTFVAPVFEDDKVVGYQSVRVKPQAAQRNNAQKLYASLRKGSKWLTRLHGITLKAKTLFWNCLIVAAMAVVFTLGKVGLPSPLLFAVLTGAVFAVIGAHLTTHRLQKAAESSRTVIDNSLANTVYGGGADEIGQLVAAVEIQRAALRTLRGRIEDVAVQLATTSRHSTYMARQTQEGNQRQRQNLEHIATAVTEMSATIQEIAQSTQIAADTSSKIQSDVAQSRRLVIHAADTMHNISGQISGACETIESLQEQSVSIGSVVDVIRSISEQTNLLALNAAIEAARAGEQGRGFAVVADEVRSLANRTRQSTGEIQDIIEKLQGEAKVAVETMQASRTTADQGAEESNTMVESLNAIAERMNVISDMNTQIATAAEEHSSVSNEVNRNVVAVSRVADETTELANEGVGKSHELDQMVVELRSIIRQFAVG